MTLKEKDIEGIIPFCECGCGEKVSKLGNRFVHNHHSKVSNNTPKVYKKMVEYAKSIKGKTWEKIHGEEKAKKMKKAMSEIHKGKVPSKELRALWSFQRQGSRNSFYGKSHSEETKEKIKNAFLGKSLSKEHRENVSKGLAKAVVEGRMNNHPKQYIQGKFYSAKNKRYIKYRSSYELFAYQLLERIKKVKVYHVEPFAIPYTYRSENRHYVPDLLITYQDDSQELIEIKPRNFIKDKGNQAKFRAAKKVCKDNKMDFSILTSKKGSTDVLKVGMCKLPLYKQGGERI